MDCLQIELWDTLEKLTFIVFLGHLPEYAFAIARLPMSLRKRRVAGLDKLPLGFSKLPLRSASSISTPRSKWTRQFTIISPPGRQLGTEWHAQSTWEQWSNSLDLTGSNWIWTFSEAEVTHLHTYSSISAQMNAQKVNSKRKRDENGKLFLSSFFSVSFILSRLLQDLLSCLCFSWSR